MRRRLLVVSLNIYRRWYMFLSVILVAIVEIAVALSSLAHNRQNDDALGPKLELYLGSVVTSLDPRVPEALKKIDGTGRRLLAARGYLRSARGLGSRWSWSDEEIKKYKESDEYREALAELEKIKKKFEEQNPGYSLHVNTEVRSLETQIEKWNETPSVRSAGDEILSSALKEIAKPSYKDVPDKRSIAGFQQFLRSYRLNQDPTVAAPGLSPHGQMRAFDFQIKQGNKIIAGTETAKIDTVWEREGWTQRLNNAVTSASQKFSGPLLSPREPWHYTFTP
jgi:hypothetical protein